MSSETRKRKVSDEDSADYVKWTDENVRARSEFFATLNVDKIAADLQTLSSSSNPSKGQAQHPKPKASHEPQRRSSRLQNKPPASLNEDDIANAVTSETLSVEEEKKRQLIKEEAILTASCRREDYTTSEDDIALHEVLRKATIDVGSSRASDLSNTPVGKIAVASASVSKVCKERALALAVHPSSGRVIIAAGDIDGGIGIHCEGTSIGRCEYVPHIRSVSSLAFGYTQLYSSSYDGTLRVLELNRAEKTFNLMYSDEEERGITGIDLPDDHCIWLSQTDGTVVRLDARSKRHLVGVYRVNARHCRSISTNSKEHIVCTASRNGVVAFFDDRYMPAEDSYDEKPLATAIHSASASSAYLNPSDPHLVISTSYDNTVRISRYENGDCKTLASLSHNNQTGRFLTPFRAVWHPSGGNLFAIGSLQRPRMIQLFSLSGKNVQCKELLHDEISTVQSLVAFHKSLPVIVGINSSGRACSVHLKL